jgi:hypothetical protein
MDYRARYNARVRAKYHAIKLHSPERWERISKRRCETDAYVSEHKVVSYGSWCAQAFVIEVIVFIGYT